METHGKIFVSGRGVFVAKRAGRTETVDGMTQKEAFCIKQNDETKRDIYTKLGDETRHFTRNGDSLS